MFDRIRRDLAFAVRGLLRGRLVSAVAVISLAIGIAANTTVFSLVQALEFPSLIYPEASRIVFLESRNNVRGLAGMLVSLPDAMDITAASRTLRPVSIRADQASTLRVADATSRVAGKRVEPAFFSVMQVPAAIGRVLIPGNGDDVVVLSDNLWRSQFGGQASILGAAIQLDGKSVTVAGIMPPRFDPDADFWVPLRASPGAYSRDDRQFELFARLAPGASTEDAAKDLLDISARLAVEHPETNKDWVMTPTRLAQLHGRDSRQSFLLLQTAVGFVLLIACANIANILLARGTDRRLEMAVRISLGATRQRVMSGLLAEALLLSAIGGAFGVLLSVWGIRFTSVLGGFPAEIEPRLNVYVLGFTFALSTLTGMICGLAPAIRASSVKPEAVLREAGRGTRGTSGGGVRVWLASGQIAAAVVLATSAVLMLRTLQNRQQVQLGFEPGGAARADLVLPENQYRDVVAQRGVVNEVVGRLLSRPDIAAAGASAWALPTGAGGQRQLTLPAERDAALPLSIRRGIEAVTLDYFDALGIAVKQGRAFSDADASGAAPVAIVNEELAHRLWPRRNSVGELLRLGSVGEDAPVVTVVGVVASTRRSPMHDLPIALVYLPFSQYPNATVTLVARARGDVSAALRALPAAVHEADGTLLVEGLRTLEADAAQFVAPVRLLTSLLAAFAVTGVLLAALGVFGTMTYMVSQRGREMAVRSALGANRTVILRLVFASALRITALGVLAGATLALWVTAALSSHLFGVSPTDPLSYAGVILALSCVSLAACYRPARAAASADPASILRQ